jgi:HemY protein
VRTLLWILLLCALAVGMVALAVRSSAGYVQIVWPPYRVELSLILVLALLAAAFAAAYLVARTVAAMLDMPAQVRTWRELRQQKKAHAALTEALHDYFSGRYARAEKAAANAIELGEQPGLAAMLAARAAHELRAPERRDAYLVQGAAHLPEEDIMRAITAADLLLEERRAADALAVLQTQPQKHTAGLRLELKALQLAKDWEKSLVVIDQLERRKVFDAEQAAELRRHALAEHLKRRATDATTLDDAWRKVPDALKRDLRVARAAADGYIAVGAGARAGEIIERSLDNNWDSELAARYADCTGADAVRQIERAERWLTAQPRDAALLLTLGRLCAQQGLWGKAQSYLDASISIEPTYQAHLAAAQLQEKLGNAEAAQRHTRQSLTLATAKLEQKAVPPRAGMQ